MHPLPQVGLNILVAEDETLAAMVIEEILTAEGHSVSLAADGSQALALVRRGTFDVLLTDLAMPIMSGLDLVRTLRSEGCDLPVIVMTGYLSPDTAVALRGLPCPPLAVLQKPFDISRLLTLLTMVQRPALALAAD